MSIRWRLARRLAPFPIVRSPGTEDGQWLFIQSGDHRVWIKAKTMEVQRKVSIDAHRYGVADTAYHPVDRGGTFSGTLG